MDYQHFHIKNMVCEHCAEVLEAKMVDAGLPVKHIELGKVELQRPTDAEGFTELIEIAHENGFEVISDRSSQLVEQIKHLIIDIVHLRKSLDTNLSEFLSTHIHKDYQYLSRLFSSVEGKSIERYFILQKIERAKELIVYDEQNLTEISYDLGYSSQQHFSRQFKKETGLAPSHFKDIKEHKRTPIDRI